MLMALVFTASLFVSSPFAQQQPKTPTCSNYTKDANGKMTMSIGYAGLTNHIAGCIRETLDMATDTFFDPQKGVYPLVKKAISAMMTLAVILFGVLAAFGMLEKVGRDSVMLLLKIGAVAYFTTNTDMIYHTLIDVMDTTAKQVLSFVPSSGPSDGSGSDFSQIECFKNMEKAQKQLNSANPANAKGVAGPWLAVDCMLDSVIGIKVESKGGINQSAFNDAKAYNEKYSDSDQGLSRGLFYFFFSSMQSSILGLIIAVLGFVFIWGMINMVIKALFIYISGYLGLAVMVIISPIFIPLVLFQVTRQFFDKWVKLLISFALQPIIILIFIALTIAAVDLATFSGEYSVMYRIAGEASRQKGFSLNRYLTQQRGGGGTEEDGSKKQSAIIQDKKLNLAFIKGDSKDSTPIKEIINGGLIKQLTDSDCTKELMNADQSVRSKCGQAYPVGLTRTNLDWKLMADARNPAVQVRPADADGKPTNAEKEIAREVLSAVIFAAVVIFVMNQLLMVIPVVSYDLFGDFGQSPNLAKAGGSLPWQQKMRSSLGGGGRK